MEVFAQVTNNGLSRGGFGIGDGLGRVIVEEFDLNGSENIRAAGVQSHDGFGILQKKKCV